MGRLYVEGFMVVKVKVVRLTNYIYRLDPGRVLPFSLVPGVKYNLPN